ncbi:hypothetical protein DYB25_002251 [Aphanomyces astaci]|uniref:Uncharacterized protein n=1 Tax=Aphanomyces astaci TaxID=112090 RepID=A0A397C7V9_APHAT|nr:hypothetical protein DYB25_002251 [Aphanomyces astaci]RHY41005.1 hypothetical protein DYB38_005707 [Aphanomyces astaci]RHY62779.1 hypothetical protein DYB30_002382 [Aphanomyces astaci]RHY75591.1 hypothetical protein DYB34_013069 [Aphanomyces astaci]RHZ12058.1 hypothetical protein DYB31_002885 [Aphanomyces astaci]
MKRNSRSSNKGRQQSTAGGSASARKTWFDDSTIALVAMAQDRALKAKVKGSKGGDDRKEARQRSSQLSTSSDTVGVSFAGAAFQADYFASKFTKRGQLVYTILHDVLSKSPHVLPPSETLAVASFGGGPGTDAAGIVWIQRELFPTSSVHCVLFDYETSWKRYVKTLDDLYGDAVSVSFAPCDVTHPLDTEPNRHVSEIETMDILLFCFVCHETSARQRNLQFYLDVATAAKVGALVILADVKTKSKECLEQVAIAMASVRRIQRLTLSKAPTAEAVVLRVEA